MTDATYTPRYLDGAGRERMRAMSAQAAGSPLLNDLRPVRDPETGQPVNRAARRLLAAASRRARKRPQ